ncbi:MAG: FAD-binding protein [Firmicutes bacterium]|nr:FAD-binding protein [Bacillota bacterium]
MYRIHKDLVIIGGGPAGLAAASAAKEAGIDDLVILERDFELGGILPQCIHNGFGLHHFKEELTGPEYAQRFIEKVRLLEIDIKLNTMVLDITSERKVYAMNTEEGYMEIEAGAIILAMGCREKAAGAIGIPGTRPAGIFTAGTAQRYTNIEGYLPGKEVVILGSGDIGLIMARRMQLEGANVKAVVELLPYTGGLSRNVVQCLNDYDIPLLLQHTVTEIYGKERLEGVIVCQVDDQGQPIQASKKWIDCDTLLLSVGLIPENELSKSAGVEFDNRTGGPIVNEGRETSINGIFACGNVLHVHDLVDYVTEEAEIAGYWAARFIKEEMEMRREKFFIRPGTNVRYVLPHKVELFNKERKRISLYMRVTEPLTDVIINILNKDKKLLSFPKPYVRPGEMINIPLPEKTIQGFDESSEIRIDILEKGVE